MISDLEALCPTARLLLSGSTCAPHVPAVPSRGSAVSSTGPQGASPVSLGLTKAGLPRQRRPKAFRRTPEQIRLARTRKYNARYRQKFVLDGLTTHGTERIHRVWRTLDKMVLQGKDREAMRRRLIREEFKQSGLTTRGTVRKTQIWPRELQALPKRERNRILCNDWLTRNRYTKGLTAKGTVPRSQQQTPVEKAWHEFRSGGLVSAAI